MFQSMKVLIVDVFAKTKNSVPSTAEQDLNQCGKTLDISGLILGLHSANERRRYKVE